MTSLRTTNGGMRVRLLALVGTVVLLLLATSAVASADRAWRIDAMSNTTAQPGTTFDYIVQVMNIGSEDMTGDPIELLADLPDGTTAVSATVLDATSRGEYPCVDASDGVSPIGPTTTSVLCSNPEPVPNAVNSGGRGFQLLRLAIDVPLATTGTLRADFRVSGGGAPDSVGTADVTEVSDTLPGFGIDTFDAQMLANAAGDSLSQAGGHPYEAKVAIDFNTITDPRPVSGNLWPVEPVKNVIVDLPPGVVGDPTGVDTCTSAQLANGTGGISALPLCPSTSQVGTVLLRLNGYEATPDAVGPYPVFNLEPPPDVPARFGFNVLGSVVVMDAEVRSGGDYGLTVNVRNIPQALAVAGTTATFWGVPSDSSHDSQRACAGQSAPSDGGPTCTTGSARVAFLRNPTSCTDPGVGLPTTARVDSWTNPGVFDEMTSISHRAPGYPLVPGLGMGDEEGPTGCDRVPFDPRLEATPLTTKAGAPSGFQFDLSIPQTDDPDVIAQSDLRQAKVTLPMGVRVSPSSANGLGACSPAEIDLNGSSAPNCPQSSKIGSLTIDTPVLDDPLRGSVFLARQRDNPFGSLLSIYLVAEGPGVVVKLAGRVDADPISGQLTTTFSDNPQLPFSNLHLEFKGGARAPLVIPKQCGSYTTTAEMTGWNGRVVVSESTFQTSHDGAGAPCPPSQFSPDFSAGTEDPIAGASSPLHLRFARGDDDEELKAVTVDMPNGLTAKIASAELCPEDAAKAGSCSDASKVGNVTVGAGAGPSPFYITNGRAYLTGPYGGGPFGLSIVVPAVAGPFDLGNVVVRSAIFVDKHTAEVRVVSDPLPTILEGIPLDVRDVRVSVDRPGFMVNPTSCATKLIRGSLTSVTGATAPVASRFQVGECAALNLTPRMGLRVGGRGRTQRNRTTPFTATLRLRAGQSNLRFVRVTLPTTINARLTVINDACTRAEFEAGNCEDARTGKATAVTPLLRDPLTGGVYFVRNGNPLPDLFVRLRGQVDFDLIGRITIPGSKRLRTTFDSIPDVPVSSFTLALDGGREGSVGNATNLCSRRGKTAKAEIDFIGQNGKVKQLDQRLKIGGCRAARRGRRGRGRNRRRGR